MSDPVKLPPFPALRIVLYGVMAILLLNASVYWLRYTQLGELTRVPETTWVPIVNPLDPPHGDPIGGLYVVNVGLGVSCYVYQGGLIDQLSCVKVTP